MISYSIKPHRSIIYSYTLLLQYVQRRMQKLCKFEVLLCSGYKIIENVIKTAHKKIESLMALVSQKIFASICLRNLIYIITKNLVNVAMLE